MSDDKPQAGKGAGKRRRLTREDVAQVEVGHTEVSPAVKWAVVGLFLLSVFTPAAVEMVGFAVDRARGEAEGALPHPFSIFERIPSAAAEGFKQALKHDEQGLVTRLWRGTFRANALALREINRYEDELSERSRLGAIVRPPTQFFLTAVLGAGNEQVYPGRNGWLFYRPGFDYVTGPAFLSGRQLEKRAAAGSEYVEPPQPDPRRAVLQLHRQLMERGIRLILLPTPVKPVVHPEKYDRSAAGAEEPVRNPSFDRFVGEMREAGVLVMDPAPAMFERGRDDPQYLPGDTHWRPDAMERTAAALKEFIAERDLLPARSPVGYTRRAQEVTEHGDLVGLLDIPEEYGLFEPTSVRVHPVAGRGAARWQPHPSADVLLLGDSFSNIFSLEAMGWGESAGLAEQLSFDLQRPVDRIVRNAAGAKATREILSRELARGRDRLADKKVVIWQFATRELSVGDWKLLPMEVGEPPPQEFVVPEAGRELTVTGTVAAVSGVPRPGSVPYRDHIFTVHLMDLSGPEIEGGQAVVYLRSMRDNRLTPAARLTPGDRVRVRLRPWHAVEGELGGLNRSNMEDIALQLQEHAWGELVGEEAGEQPQRRGAAWPLWAMLSIFGACLVVRIYTTFTGVDRE